MMVNRILIGLTAISVCVSGVVSGEDRVVLEVSGNPSPEIFPKLGVWQEYAKNQDVYYTLLSASFPNVPGFTCDLWCFESSGIHFRSAREAEEGVVVMRHSWDDHEWDILTTVTPLEGAIDVEARLESTAKESPKQANEYPVLNICWQLRRAQGFSSYDKNAQYPEFVQRCFIFTERGRIFLHNTRRRPIPVRPATDKENNPPWVQMYAAKSKQGEIRSDETAWADYSPDRYTYPIIGTASRDGKYLAAMATGSEEILSQAWHDCMHNNARWLPTADGKDKRWRVKIYAMKNDPEKLLTRFRDDFPHVEPWQ